MKISESAFLCCTSACISDKSSKLKNLCVHFQHPSGCYLLSPFIEKLHRFSRLERGDNACKWKVEKREKSSKFQVANYSIFNQLCKICYCRVELHACSAPWERSEMKVQKLNMGKNATVYRKKGEACLLHHQLLQYRHSSAVDTQSIDKQRGDERAQIPSIRLSYKQFSSVVGCYHLAAS